MNLGNVYNATLRASLASGLIDAAGLDEGLLSLSLSNLLYMDNPYSYKKCQWRITARPRISAQASQSNTTTTGARSVRRARLGQERCWVGAEDASWACACIPARVQL